VARIPQDLPGVGDPNYLGYSKGITQPEADKSAGVALSGLANVMDAGIKAADIVVKEDIKQKVYSGVDERRDAFTQYLQNVQSGKTKSGSIGVDGSDENLAGTIEGANKVDENPMNAYAQAKPDDSIWPDPPGVAKPMPNDLKQLPKDLDVLYGAYEKGLPYTKYYAEMLTLSKDLRSQYPGYRDYIDGLVSKALGTDPANAQIRSLVQTINASMSGANVDRNRVLSLFNNVDIMGSLGPQGPELRQGLMSGKYDPSYVWSQIQDKIAWKAANDRKLSDYNVADKSADANKRFGNQHISEDMYKSSSDWFVSTAHSLGYNTPQKYDQFLTMVANGKTTMTDQQGQEITTAVVDARQRFYRAKWDEYHKPLKDRDGNTYTVAGLMGSDIELDKAINGSMKLFDNVIDKLKNKDYGLAADDMRTVSNMQATAQRKVYENKDIGTMLSINEALRKIDPILAGKFSESISKKLGIETGIQTMFDNAMKEVATQRSADKGQDIRNSKHIDSILAPPEQPTTPQRSGSSLPPAKVTMNKVFAEAQKNNVTDNNYYAGVSKTFADNVTDPKVSDKAKIGFLQAAFDPTNRNHLAWFRPDYWKPDGTYAPGKYAVYSDYTSKGVADEVKRLDRIQPGLAGQYEAWVKNEFAVQLFGKEAKELSSLMLNTNYQISYNSDQSRFDIKPKAEFEAASQFKNTGLAAVRQYRYAKTIIDRLNIGIQGQANWARSVDGDPDAFVMAQLRNAGFDPNKKAEGTEVNPIQAMGEAMVLSRTKPTEGGSQNAPQSPTNAPGSRKTESPRGSTTPNTSNDIMHYSSPDRRRGGTPMDFVRNPTNEPIPEAMDVTGRKMPPGQNLTDPANTITGIEYGPIEPSGGRRR